LQARSTSGRLRMGPPARSCPVLRRSSWRWLRAHSTEAATPGELTLSEVAW